VCRCRGMARRQAFCRSVRRSGGVFGTSASGRDRSGCSVLGCCLVHFVEWNRPVGALFHRSWDLLLSIRLSGTLPGLPVLGVVYTSGRAWQNSRNQDWMFSMFTSTYKFRSQEFIQGISLRSGYRITSDIGSVSVLVFRGGDSRTTEQAVLECTPKVDASP